jgi:hypothetical protein
MHLVVSSFLSQIGWPRRLREGRSGGLWPTSGHATVVASDPFALVAAIGGKQHSRACVPELPDRDAKLLRLVG